MHSLLTSPDTYIEIILLLKQQQELCCENKLYKIILYIVLCSIAVVDNSEAAVHSIFIPAIIHIYAPLHL